MIQFVAPLAKVNVKKTLKNMIKPVFPNLFYSQEPLLKPIFLNKTLLLCISTRKQVFHKIISCPNHLFNEFEKLLVKCKEKRIKHLKKISL